MIVGKSKGYFVLLGLIITTTTRNSRMEVTNLPNCSWCREVRAAETNRNLIYFNS